MIHKNSAYSKFELLSKESFDKRKKKHDELKEKSRQIRESLCETGECELDITKLEDQT